MQFLIKRIEQQMQVGANQKSKTDYCYYCYFPITAPLNQSIVKCPNSSCRKLNIFLCHIINPQQKLNDIICLKCSTNFILMNCQSCGGFQAWNKSVDNFRNGMKHQCVCEAISTLIFCNNCQSLLSIKGKKSHQLAMIECKSCNYEFRYKICQDCHMLIYKEKWDTSKPFVCSNTNCTKSNVLNPYDMKGKKEYFAKRFSQFDDRNRGNNFGEMGEKESCKICFNSEANMINTKCYHLAVCQKCASKLHKECPICRSQGGQFKKVFKA